MKIISFDPENKYYQRQFIRFPFDLYRNDPHWVPPLLMDMRQIFDRKKHGFYEHGMAHFLLAIKDDRVVGRLAVLNNHNMQTNAIDKTGNFYLFETEEDPDIAKRLFEKGITWAKDQGLSELLGPKGMTPLDGLGVLVKGFEHQPAFGMPYNPIYYPQYLSQCGFELVRTIESGYVQPQAFKLPEKVMKAAELIKEKKGFHLLQINSRRELKKAVLMLGEMYNNALVGTEGTAPLSTNDLETITLGLLWIAKPNLIKLIMKNDEPVGFILAYPDISDALKASNGRLFPFGWIRILSEKYHTSWVDINGIGIVEHYRGLAATALMFAELYKSITSVKQFKHAEIIQIGTENERMHRELRGMGISFYKTHALFKKRNIENQ